MANAIYPKYKKKLMSGGANVNLLTGNVKLALVDLGAYAYDALHEFLSDIPAGARIGLSGNLSSKAVSDAGAFTSANNRWDAITGTSVEALAMYVDTGTPATSPLVAFWDTGITGLPVTPAGGSYNGIPPSGVWFVL
jgi:hypothetical protein